MWAQHRRKHRTWQNLHRQKGPRQILTKQYLPGVQTPEKLPLLRGAKKRGVFYVQRDSRECLHSQIHLSHSWYVRFQSTAPLFPRSSLVRNIFSPHSDAELSCFPEMQSHFPNFRAVQTYRITPPYSGRLLTISTTLIIGMLLFQINNFAAKRFSEKRNFFRIFKSW